MNSNDNVLRLIPAIDLLPKNFPSKLSKPVALPKCCKSINIDIADRLINGQIGTVKHISFIDGHISKVYVEFNDKQCGIKKIGSDCFAKQHKWVLIEKAEANIMIRTNKESSHVIKRT